MKKAVKPSITTLPLEMENKFEDEASFETTTSVKGAKSDITKRRFPTPSYPYRRAYCRAYNSAWDCCSNKHSDRIKLRELHIDRDSVHLRAGQLVLCQSSDQQNNIFTVTIIR